MRRAYGSVCTAILLLNRYRGSLCVHCRRNACRPLPVECSNASSAGGCSQCPIKVPRHRLPPGSTSAPSTIGGRWCSRHICNMLRVRPDAQAGTMGQPSAEVAIRGPPYAQADSRCALRFAGSCRPPRGGVEFSAIAMLRTGPKMGAAAGFNTLQQAVPLLSHFFHWPL